MRLTTKIYPQDYHAFGSVMAGRCFSNASYRFGFNGMEKDNETFTDAYDFEARIFDNRICRWLSTDPREGEYAWQSTYAYFSNCPIGIIDFLGMGDDDPPKKGVPKVLHPDANPDGSCNSYIDNTGKKVNYIKEDDIWLPEEKTIYLTPNSRKNSINSLVNKNQNLNNGFYNWAKKVNEKFLNDLKVNFIKTTTITTMYFEWVLGIGKEERTFTNDIIANSFRNANITNQARDFWYKEVYESRKTILDGVTNFGGIKVKTGGNFGIPGVILAGNDLVEQFVGSFNPEIASDGTTLTFKITNTTSYKSYMFGVVPRWARSSFRFAGDTKQTYIFTEPINFSRLIK